MTDVALIGAGIMSATLGAMLRRLEPGAAITVVERLDSAAGESSDPWNNAGTGHAGLCELFYTPQRPDGSIDIAKAVRVNEQFQVTRQFWAYAVQNGLLEDPRDFVHPIPHVSFVHGADGVDYLRRRHRALSDNPLFAGTDFITDFGEFAARLPAMATGRDRKVPVALDWAPHGTDVDFGALTSQLIGYGVRHGTAVHFGHEVRALRRESDASWTLVLANRRTGETRRLNAKFVFLGAGERPWACCSARGSPKCVASAVSRSAGYSCAAGPPSSPPHTEPRCTAPRFQARRRRPPRTWTPGWSTVRRRCCSDHLPVGRRSFSSTVEPRIYRDRSASTTSGRCWAPGSESVNWSGTCSANCGGPTAPGSRHCGSSCRMRITRTGTRSGPANGCR